MRRHTTATATRAGHPGLRWQLKKTVFIIPHTQSLAHLAIQAIQHAIIMNTVMFQAALTRPSIASVR